MLPEAVDVMLPLLSEHFGNPSGVHIHARQARAVLEESRDRLADVIGCLRVFTPHWWLALRWR